MNYETVKIDLKDRVLTLTLNRPDHLNAFTVRMADELVAVFVNASADDDVGAIVVTGSGKAFCAGMDLGGEGNVFGLNETLRPTMADLDERFDDPEIVAGVRDTAGRVTLAIYDCAKPVIAAINGAAVGAGATMTLAMDIRLASDKARFGFVFGKIGIVPDACSSWFLPKVVGIAKALQWTYTGEILDAAEALRTGLVGEVVPGDKLLARANELALMLAHGRSAVSTALIRQMMYRNSSASHPLEAHKVESLGVFYTSMADGKEGVAAFLQKRAPEFESRTSQMPEFYPWWQATSKV